MKELKRFRIFHVLALIIFLVSILMPQQSHALRPLDDVDISQNSPSLHDNNNNTGGKSKPHLQPINEKLLDDLSPALVAPAKKKFSQQEYVKIMNQRFENSVCFQRCHNKNDFSPSDHTAKQWRLLIEANGHAIFGKIAWENPKQKDYILNYLLENAKKSKPDSSGIGVW